MLIKPQLLKKWAVCPFCGAKVVIFDNTSNCSGVFVKCTRKCKKEFELIIQNGNQKIIK
jgi:transcription elongation factor Elf1